MSLESEEVRSLADRILVIYEGRIVGECAGGASEETIMALAVDHHAGERLSSGLAENRIAS